MDNPEKASPSGRTSPRQRLQTAGILILIFVGFFLSTPDWLLCAVGILVVLVAAWEYFEMTDRLQSRGDRALCLLLAGLFPLAAYVGKRDCLYGTVFLSFLVLSFRSVLSAGEIGDRYQSLNRRLYGVLYTGFTLSHFLLMTDIGDWRRWIFAVLIVIYLGDGAAYFAGTYLGKRPLAGRLSPRKTWEGAIGGLAGSVAGIYVCKLLFLPGITVNGALVFSVVLAVCGQLGDLAESLIKRHYQLKDSGHVLPGHGGILDRIDSLLFAVPAAYYLILFLQG